MTRLVSTPSGLSMKTSGWPLGIRDGKTRLEICKYANGSLCWVCLGNQESVDCNGENGLLFWRCSSRRTYVIYGYSNGRVMTSIRSILNSFSCLLRLRRSLLKSHPEAQRMLASLKMNFVKLASRYKRLEQIFATLISFFVPMSVLFWILALRLGSRISLLESSSSFKHATCFQPILFHMLYHIPPAKSIKAAEIPP